MLTEDQAREVRRLRDAMRQQAAGVTQHAFWDWISELNALLAGEETLLSLSTAEYIQECRQALREIPLVPTGAVKLTQGE